MYQLKKLKNFYQRGKRGWAEEDVWSFDTYLAKIIRDSIRHLAKNNIGCPSEFYDADKVNNECQRWEELLEEIASGFDAYLDDCAFDLRKRLEKGKIVTELDKAVELNRREKVDRAFDLLKEHFPGLWD